MKILVTGGAGYIGSHVVAKLIEQGHQVVVIDDFSTGFRRLLHPGAQFFKGDVKDVNLIRSILQETSIEAIFHFAAFTSVAESVRVPEKYYENNLGGTVSILKAVQATSSVKYFVFSSTAAVYSDPGKKLVSEESLINPPTAYGKSKWMSEQALMDFSAARGLKVTILRYFNVAGASSDGKWGQIGDEHTVLVKRAALAAVGKISEIQIFGTDYETPDGTAIRDFIHVEDLADLHGLALDKLKNSQFSGILNCGYGKGFSVRQVLDTMKKVSGKKFTVIEKARRPGDLPSVVADNSELLRRFAWQPKHQDLEQICRSAYLWEMAIS